MSSRFAASSIDLKGQVALVTGGGRGIGRAIAQALAAAGALVAVMARSANELAETAMLIEQAGGRALAVPADVTDEAAVRAALAQIERSLGPVDLLVNNAATIGPIGPFWESNAGDWWRGMEVNLRGPVLCAHAVLPGMVSRHWGRIVNVASGAGAVAFTYFSSYVAGKTALIRLTECLAAETKPYGIAVFAISPGTVRTAMSEVSLNSSEGRKWLPWFQRIFDEGLDVPPERPAQLVLALASGNADSLSGRFFSLTDDLDAMVKSVAEVERENLYALRVRRLEGGRPNPAVASILAAGTRAAGD